jgi:hypothetical protein
MGGLPSRGLGYICSAQWGQGLLCNAQCDARPQATAQGGQYALKGIVVG